MAAPQSAMGPPSSVVLVICCVPAHEADARADQPLAFSTCRTPVAGVDRWGPESRFAELTPLGYRPVSQDNTIPDDAAETLEAVAEVRRRLSETPASVVVANHAMGLFELAAIHLSDEPPRLEEARLAIDSFALLVEGLGERIGEHHDTLVAALANIRLVFVERSRTAGE